MRNRRDIAVEDHDVGQITRLQHALALFHVFHIGTVGRVGLQRLLERQPAVRHVIRPGLAGHRLLDGQQRVEWVDLPVGSKHHLGTRIHEGPPGLGTTEAELSRLNVVSRPAYIYPYWHQHNLAAERLPLADRALHSSFDDLGMV